MPEISGLNIEATQKILFYILHCEMNIKRHKINLNKTVISHYIGNEDADDFIFYIERAIGKQLQFDPSCYSYGYSDDIEILFLNDIAQLMCTSSKHDLNASIYLLRCILIADFNLDRNTILASQKILQYGLSNKQLSEFLKSIQEVSANKITLSVDYLKELSLIDLAKDLLPNLDQSKKTIITKLIYVLKAELSKVKVSLNSDTRLHHDLKFNVFDAEAFIKCIRYVTGKMPDINLSKYFFFGYIPFVGRWVKELTIHDLAEYIEKSPSVEFVSAQTIIMYILQVEMQIPEKNIHHHSLFKQDFKMNKEEFKQFLQHFEIAANKTIKIDLSHYFSVKPDRGISDLSIAELAEISVKSSI